MELDAKNQLRDMADAFIKGFSCICITISGVTDWYIKLLVFLSVTNNYNSWGVVSNDSPSFISFINVKTYGEVWYSSTGN